MISTNASGNVLESGAVFTLRCHVDENGEGKCKVIFPRRIVKDLEEHDDDADSEVFPPWADSDETDDDVDEGDTDEDNTP